MILYDSKPIAPPVESPWSAIQSRDGENDRPYNYYVYTLCANFGRWPTTVISPALIRLIRDYLKHYDIQTIDFLKRILPSDVETTEKRFRSEDGIGGINGELFVSLATLLQKIWHRCMGEDEFLLGRVAHA